MWKGGGPPSRAERPGGQRDLPWEGTCYGSGMSVERLNVPELASPPGYSHLAIARGSTLVFTAGAVPLDADGELVGADDPVTQTDQVVANLIAALTAAGARPDDVVKTTVYVAGADHDRQATVWEAVQRSPIAAAPSTLVGVPILGIPRAARGDRSRRGHRRLTRLSASTSRGPGRSRNGGR